MKYEIYQDKRGEWRWRLKAGNGNILAVSSEGYKSIGYCRYCLNTVAASQTTPIFEI